MTEETQLPPFEDIYFAYEVKKLSKCESLDKKPSFTSQHLADLDSIHGYFKNIFNILLLIKETPVYFLYGGTV